MRKFYKLAAVAAIGLGLACSDTALAQTVVANDGPLPASLSEHQSNNAKIVWGGGPKEVSSYSSKIVPVVIDKLTAERLAGYQWGGPSDGTLMNATKVTVNPTHLALGQADILQSLNGQTIPNTSWRYSFTVVQKDIGDECLYMVTKSPHYETWGHVLENSWDISIATGGEQSGSYGTLTRILMQRYPALQDATVNSVGGADKIVQSVIDGTNSFGFFVMRPDPENKVFEMINNNNLTMVPVIDFDLEDVYQFKSLKVSNATWGGFGKEAKYQETACTHVQLITGNPEMLSADQSRDKRRLEATIKRVESIDGASFKESVVSQFTSWSDYIDAIRDIGEDKLKLILDASKAKIEELKG